MTMLTASDSTPKKRRARNAINRDPPSVGCAGPSQEDLKQQAAEPNWLDRQLSELGKEILTEPVPDSLLRAISQFSHL